MALQTSPGVWTPEPHIAGGQGSIVLDAAGEHMAMRFVAPKTGNLRKIHFRVNNVTTSQSLTPTLQDEDVTNGLPDGVADQTGAAIAVPSANAWNTADFTGVERAVTVGDIFWMVTDWTSTAGNLQIGRGQSNYNSESRCADNTGGAYATRAFNPIGILEYDDASHSAVPGIDWGVRGFASFNNSAGNQERGLRFRVPYPFKIGGVGFGYPGSWAGNGTFTLYDSDETTSRGVAAFDKDSLVLSAQGALLPTKPFAAFTGLANTYYHVVLKPDSASNVLLAYYDVNAAADLDNSSGGQDFHWVERAVAGTGAFTATLTRRGSIWVYLTAFDDGVGGGGMLVHPGMGGGARG